MSGLGHYEIIRIILDPSELSKLDAKTNVQPQDSVLCSTLKIQVGLLGKCESMFQKERPSTSMFWLRIKEQSLE